MELISRLYLGLLLAVALGRLMELRHSRANQRKLQAAGSVKAAEPGYKWMVGFHSAMLVACGVEVVMLGRPWIASLGVPALALFVIANAARWWVIRTLGARWNVEVMPASLGVVTAQGPYKWVRHPNYTAVFVEMLALPLVHSAWITASAGAVFHLIVLRRRVALEESVMVRDAAWRDAFAGRARFIPGLL